MEYVYATLTLTETGAEINERNLTAVLEAAGADVVESRVKAIIAALEDVDIEALGEAAQAPTNSIATDDAAGTGASGPFDELDLGGDEGDATTPTPGLADEIEDSDDDSQAAADGDEDR
jgi:large subunit ribosomal protein L12